LRLTKEQVYDLVLTLQEVQPYFSDYYYFSRNCSLLLGKLIESVAPELDLGAVHAVWSTPIGILKRTVERLGDAQTPMFHPSNRTRFLTLYDGLDDEAKDLFDRILATG